MKKSYIQCKYRMKSEVYGSVRKIINEEYVMHDVFISYSHKNKNIADAICNRLESSGVKCWYAPRDIGSGAIWEGAIVQAIEGAKIFVLVFTEYSNQAPQVFREVAQAAKNGCVIIPFRVDDVQVCDKLSYYLESIHWINALTPPLERSLEVLQERVHGILGTKANFEPVGNIQQKQPARPEAKQKSWVLPTIIIGSLTLVLVLLVCLFVIWLQAGRSIGTYIYENFLDTKEQVTVPEEETANMEEDTANTEEDTANTDEDTARMYNSQGVDYYHEKNYPEAVKLFTKAAELGYARAQNNLGVCYALGHGVDQPDYAEAFKWYTLAAENGNSDAQNNLGDCYYYGRGVTEVDYAKAIEWYAKSAAQGNQNGMHNLGMCYENGHGVAEVDYAKAIEWYTAAAEQGNQISMKALVRLYTDGVGIEKDPVKAAYWTAKLEG